MLSYIVKRKLNFPIKLQFLKATKVHHYNYSRNDLDFEKSVGNRYDH